MKRKYEAIAARVADPRQMADNVNDYPDEWQGVVIVTLRRDDGVTADVYVIAGVRESNIGSAQASGSARGFEDVWLFGDSPAMWCPAEFDYHDSRQMLAASHDAALAAWRAYEGPYSTGDEAETKGQQTWRSR